MNLIDQIRADREKGTAGPFACHFGDETTTCGCRYILAEYGGMGSIATIDVCEKMDGPWGDDIGPPAHEAKANARRFGRVPDMEAALLAAHAAVTLCQTAFRTINQSNGATREAEAALDAYMKEVSR